jgi:hypothetical protein
MNLELMKEIEDLKKISTELGSQLNAKIEGTVKRLVDLSLNDFERFFKSKGFQVQKDHRNATASYGSIKASLTSQPDEGYIGYTFVFDLIIGKEKYDVIFSSDKSGITSSAYSVPNDPGEKLKQEISRIRESNERTLIRINSFDGENWHLVLREQSKDTHSRFQARQTAKKFSTMYELLTSLSTEQK